MAEKKRQPTKKRPAKRGPSKKGAGKKRPSKKGSPRRGPPRKRRALAHQGGPTQTDGDTKLSAVLAEAFTLAEGPADELTHGFHSYPARMHPQIARRLLPLAQGGMVADPFCGSGTVAVESLLAGLPFIGVDLNPLAIRVAETKTRLLDAEQRKRFAATLDGVVEQSLERVRERVPSRAPLSKQEVRWYSPHTLKELAGLRAEIIALPSGEPRRDLEVLLSAIVVKFSLQRGDTSARAVPKRIRKGLPSEFFLRRGKELLDRWTDLAERAPKGAPTPKLIEDDARRLTRHVQQAKLILTSPPYGGTYDYVEHHARRYPWLGLDSSRFAAKEIGARRRLQDKHALRTWNEELGAMLKSCAAALDPQGTIILLQGDAQIGAERIPASTQITKLAPHHGLQVMATASQERPDWTGRHSRREHLILLRKPDRGPHPVW